MTDDIDFLQLMLDEEEKFKEPWMRLPDVIKVVNEINRTRFLVKDYGSRAVVGKLYADGSLLAAYPYDFKVGLMNRFVNVGTEEKPKLMTHGEIFLKHPNRREYENVVFLPDAKPNDDVLNLWRGFAYQPVKGDCALYLAHLRDNVCQCDPAKYRHLLCWMAYQVRHPGEQGHVAVVIGGLKGVGKNVAAECFMKLWGRHGMVLSSQDRITGRFNVHLRDKCIIVVDEGFFAGDKRQEGVLKNLITGDTLAIEAKGVNLVTVPNLLRLIILSNEKWIVPATADERRFFVLRCGDEQIQNKKYFGAIKHQMAHGGYEALLHHLLFEVDLTGFDVRDAMETKELVEQINQGYRGVEAAWLDCLTAGEIPGRLIRQHETNGEVQQEIGLRLEHFMNWAARRSSGRWESFKLQHLGDLFGPLGSGMNFPKRREMILGQRVNVKIIPSLKQARQLWDKKFRNGPWHQEQDWEAQTWQFE